MTLATRMILILILPLAMAGGAVAQEERPAPTSAAEPATETAAAPTAAGPERNDEERTAPSSRALREQITGILGQYPPEVGTILRLDPTLLTDQTFLARYPDLARFVAEHPEVRLHSRYYLADVGAGLEPVRQMSPFEESIETLLIILVFALIATALGWFVRTVIDYKRVNRLQRAQAEIHNRILDRFGTSEELLQYMRTPAGSKYLQFTPIRLPAVPARPSLTRAMWSIQIGVVVGAAALGMLVLAAIFSGETSQGFLAMGTIGMAIGIGFIGSAVVSIFLSRRLGLWDGQGAEPSSLEDPGLVS